MEGMGACEMNPPEVPGAINTAALDVANLNDTLGNLSTRLEKLADRLLGAQESNPGADCCGPAHDGELGGVEKNLIRSAEVASYIRSALERLERL